MLAALAQNGKGNSTKLGNYFGSADVPISGKNKLMSKGC